MVEDAERTVNVRKRTERSEWKCERQQGNSTWASRSFIMKVSSSSGVRGLIFLYLCLFAAVFDFVRRGRSETGMKRVDDMTTPLREGVTYLVPTIVGTLGGKHPSERWPILVGPRHYDVEFFNIHMPHHHLDVRFISYETWKQELGSEIVVGVGRFADGSLPAIEHKPMRCLVEAFLLNSITSHDDRAMHKHFKGAQCEGSLKRGWICPHKGTYLGSQYIDNDGVMICPAHGLRIDAATGRVL